MKKSHASIQTFLRNHHVIIFAVLAIIGLSVIVFLSYRTVVAASDVEQYQVYSPETFDQNAIQMLETFQAEQSEQQLTLPKNQRTNPFVE